MCYVRPSPGETILDAGCGTGIFTRDFLAAGASVTGLDISGQMLLNGLVNLKGMPFSAVRGTMTGLPFGDNTFDKAVSITALEFIEDAQTAVQEMFRVTRPGGLVVLATLNSLSPWAVRRRQEADEDEGHILQDAFYRSPAEILSLSDVKGEYETAVHFLKDDDPEEAVKTEKDGNAARLDTGAFLAVQWRKPV